MDDKHTLEKSRYGLKWYKNLIKEINSYGYLSLETGAYLEELYKDVGCVGNDKHL